MLENNEATYSIVFIPGPVQGPSSWFRPGQFKKKLKRRRFSKKTKVNRLQPSF
jgi:hypothetical protein